MSEDILYTHLFTQHAIDSLLKSENAILGKETDFNFSDVNNGIARNNLTIQPIERADSAREKLFFLKSKITQEGYLLSESMLEQFKFIFRQSKNEAKFRIEDFYFFLHLTDEKEIQIRQELETITGKKISDSGDVTLQEVSEAFRVAVKKCTDKDSLKELIFKAYVLTGMLIKKQTGGRWAVKFLPNFDHEVVISAGSCIINYTTTFLSLLDNIDAFDFYFMLKLSVSPPFTPGK